MPPSYLASQAAAQLASSMGWPWLWEGRADLQLSLTPIQDFSYAEGGPARHGLV